MNLRTSYFNLQLYSRRLITYGLLLKKNNETPACFSLSLSLSVCLSVCPSLPPSLALPLSLSLSPSLLLPPSLSLPPSLPLSLPPVLFCQFWCHQKRTRGQQAWVDVSDHDDPNDMCIHWKHMFLDVADKMPLPNKDSYWINSVVRNLIINKTRLDKEERPRRLDNIQRSPKQNNNELKKAKASYYQVISSKLW